MSQATANDLLHSSDNTCFFLYAVNLCQVKLRFRAKVKQLKILFKRKEERSRLIFEKLYTTHMEHSRINLLLFETLFKKISMMVKNIFGLRDKGI